MTGARWERVSGDSPLAVVGTVAGDRLARSESETEPETSRKGAKIRKDAKEKSLRKNKELGTCYAETEAKQRNPDSSELQRAAARRSDAREPHANGGTRIHRVSIEANDRLASRFKACGEGA